MVCNRCVKVVKEEFEKLGLQIKNISLGEVEILNKIPDKLMVKVKDALEKNGFELIEDKRKKIIEKIKNAVIKTIYDEEKLLIQQKNFSEMISAEVGLDYHYLSTLFSSLESMTIEQYVILQKIEHAKELLKYGELNLSEIAFKLGYSSVQHLSNQFKKVTGLSASHFKSITDNLRRPIDKVS